MNAVIHNARTLPDKYFFKLSICHKQAKPTYFGLCIATIKGYASVACAAFLAAVCPRKPAATVSFFRHVNLPEVLQ